MTLDRYLKTLGRPLVWSRARPPAEDVPLGLVDQVEVYDDPDAGPRLGIVAVTMPGEGATADRDFATSVGLKADGYWTATDRGVAFKMDNGDVYQFDTPVDQVDDMGRVTKWRTYLKTLAGVFQVDDAKRVWPSNRKTIAKSI